MQGVEKIQKQRAHEKHTNKYNSTNREKKTKIPWN